jgi:hypothetical protein
MNISTDDRNIAARQYTHAKISAAKTWVEEDFTQLTDFTEVSALMEDLIVVTAKGFRGVVLTAIVGMELNPDYDPLNDFYSCNPRSIFESGIWYALDENDIPCGKSDPLNVAKNINELNESWAQGRRPEKAALAAVIILRKIFFEVDVHRKSTLVDYFFFRLWKYANSIQKIEIVSPVYEHQSSRWYGKKLAEFTLRFPESGTTPQRVVGLLIAAVYASSDVQVKGYNESVFGTNTTSKKPADIWLVENGVETVLYEVTVKVVAKKRLDDCIDALHKMGLLEKPVPVRFICRLPKDASTLALNENNEFMYKGKRFEFVDISTLIESTTALLSEETVGDLVSEMGRFIRDVNRPIKTKEGWNSIFSKTS